MIPPTHTESEKLRIEIEGELRQQLQREYQEKYQSLVDTKEKNDKNMNHLLQQYEPRLYEDETVAELKKLTYPSTPCTFISNVVNDQFISVHGQLICIWAFNSKRKTPNLKHSIKTATSQTVAVFTNAEKMDIVTGGKNGKLYLYMLEDSTFYHYAAESHTAFDSIVNIKPLVDQYLILTKTGQLILLALSLRETIYGPEYVITMPISGSDMLQLNEDQNIEEFVNKGVIVTVSEFTDTQIILGTITGQIYSIDLATKETTLLHSPPVNNIDLALPVMDIKYNEGKLLSCSLDSSLRITHIYGGSKEVKHFGFLACVEWCGDDWIVVNGQGKVSGALVEEGFNVTTIRRCQNVVIGFGLLGELRVLE